MNLIRIFKAAYFSSRHWVVRSGDDTFHLTSADDAVKQVREIVETSGVDANVSFAPEVDVFIPHDGVACRYSPLTAHEQDAFWASYINPIQ